MWILYIITVLGPGHVAITAEHYESSTECLYASLEVPVVNTYTHCELYTPEIPELTEA